jgi:hypothetical protein
MLYLTLVFHWRIHTENFDLIELEKLDVFQDSFNLEYPAPRLEQDALAPRFWKSLPLGRSDAWQGRTDWGRCWGGGSRSSSVSGSSKVQGSYKENILTSVFLFEIPFLYTKSNTKPFHLSVFSLALGSLDHRQVGDLRSFPLLWRAFFFFFFKRSLWSCSGCVSSARSKLFFLTAFAKSGFAGLLN